VPHFLALSCVGWSRDEPITKQGWLETHFIYWIGTESTVCERIYVFELFDAHQIGLQKGSGTARGAGDGRQE
jgi:hypothetical protein